MNLKRTSTKQFHRNVQVKDIYIVECARNQKYIGWPILSRLACLYSTPPNASRPFDPECS